MSLSLTPFFSSSLPLQGWNSFERELDRDLAHMHRAINNATHYLVPDQHGVYQRQPNYSYEENEQQANLEVELPGVPKENVKIDLHDRSLVISAKRFKPGTTLNVDVSSANDHKDEDKDPQADGSDAQMKETRENENQPKPSVVYQLKLRIGHKYDSDNIQASMEGDGILKMVIPMKKKDTPRPIQIQSANM